MNDLWNSIWQNFLYLCWNKSRWCWINEAYLCAHCGEEDWTLIQTLSTHFPCFKIQFWHWLSKQLVSMKTVRGDFWAFVSSLLESTCLNILYHLKYLLRSQKFEEFQAYSDTRSYETSSGGRISYKEEGKYLISWRAGPWERPNPSSPPCSLSWGCQGSLGNEGTRAGPRPLMWRFFGSIPQNYPEDDVACAGAV